MFTPVLYVHVGTRDISASQLDEDLFTTEKAKTKKKNEDISHFSI